MTTIEHTPGPWQQDWQFIVAPDPAGIHPDIYIAEIAEEDSDDRVASPEQQEANGRLIVAGPDMLAALVLAQRALNTPPRYRVGDTDSYKIAARVDRAVALATGGRPPWNTADSRRPYSVLLLYPDDLDDTGRETFYAFVNAADAIAAVAEAQRQAIAAQGVEIDDPTDFHPLLVIEGHHSSQPLFNK